VIEVDYLNLMMQVRILKGLELSVSISKSFNIVFENYLLTSK